MVCWCAILIVLLFDILTFLELWCQVHNLSERWVVCKQSILLHFTGYAIPITLLSERIYFCLVCIIKCCMALVFFVSPLPHYHNHFMYNML